MTLPALAYSSGTALAIFAFSPFCTDARLVWIAYQERKVE